MKLVYHLLARLSPPRPISGQPRRIIFILPCCIGDVVLATAALQALRRGFPDAHITWALGSWSRAVVEDHPLLDSVLDTGEAALPVKSVGGCFRFVRQLRAGHFDLAVSLVRSPLMSLAVFLSGIPHRAGLDSAGRGFGYNIRAPVDPHTPRHEAEVYLDVIRTLGLDTSGCWANIPVSSADRDSILRLLAAESITLPFIVINPAGGRNPGMVMHSKRWPPEHFAVLAERLAAHARARIILLGGPGDADIVDAVASHMAARPPSFVGDLSFGQIAALANLSLLYIGNDTGLTHLAAASSARTVMILGPSDPARYTPFVPDALALWKPTVVNHRGVSAGAPEGWDWSRDGITPDEAYDPIRQLLES